MRKFIYFFNYIFVILSLLVTFGCNRTVENPNYNDVASRNQVNKMNSGKAASNFNVALNADPLNKCSGGYTAINLNPIYPYNDTFNIYCYDGYTGGGNCSTLGNGKPCIDLSHFLGVTIFNDSQSGFVNVGRYYGSSQEYLFDTYNPSGYGQLYTASFTISTESNSYFFEGGIGGTMPNDAANTVSHRFMDEINNLPSLLPKNARPIVIASHFRVEAYLCDPPMREVKMSIKYYYPN